MSDTPFKLKSGNTTSFKEMGSLSSPVKQMTINKTKLPELDKMTWIKGGIVNVSGDGKKIYYMDKDNKNASLLVEKNKSHSGVQQIMSKRWELGNTSSGGNLNNLVKARNTYTKGTKAWVDAQNKINKSLGSNKVHKVTVETPKKERKQLNKVAWGEGKRDFLGRKKDKSKRNRKTWWNPWD
tara:strand:- start:721 stop:1266 length:546 start_codon:yes stop_codon:yes gene_type:complete